MQQSERPVLRSWVWPLASGALMTVLLVIAVVGIDRPVTAGAVAASAAAVAIAVLVWATVKSRRRRRAYEDDLTAWASERATQSERLRIARDLHDLASHGLGLITLRAAAARGVTGTDGDAERVRALADIERAGRDATTELRRLLEVLREPAESARLHPVDSLADLPAIAAAAAESGVTATLTTDPALTEGAVSEVSAGVQLTACAVVREALVNTARHAGPVSARVVVRSCDGGRQVIVTIDDDGPAPGWRSHPGAGHGLAGLRERVAAVGGTLEAGPHGTGFRVVARLLDGSR